MSARAWVAAARHTTSCRLMAIFDGIVKFVYRDRGRGCVCIRYIYIYIYIYGFDMVCVQRTVCTALRIVVRGHPGPRGVEGLV